MAENGTASRMIKVLVRDRVFKYKKEHDQKQGQREDHGHPFLDPLRRFVVAAPDNRVARREFDLFFQQPVRLLDVAVRITINDVHVHVAGEQPVLVSDHGGTAGHPDVRQVAEGNLLFSSGNRDQHPS